MKIMRHETGHAFNYAYRLHDRPEWHELFGPYSRPYRDRFRVDPFSRDHVRHILGWYAQKHPDEDFAETFAVWLTPGLDWRERYRGWPALRKLEYVDRVMAEVGPVAVAIPRIRAEHLPVEAMDATLGEYYSDWHDLLPLGEPGHYDADLRNIFSLTGASEGERGTERAADFLARHRRELVRRIAYWTGETAHGVRQFIDMLHDRAEALELERGGEEADTLIELTAFGTAVIMNHRYVDGPGPGEDES